MRKLYSFSLMKYCFIFNLLLAVLLQGCEKPFEPTPNGNGTASSAEQTPTTREKDKSAGKETTPSVNMPAAAVVGQTEFVLVKGGPFTHAKSNFYGKSVAIANFYIGKYEVTQKEWDAVMEVNLKGVFLCTQAAIPYMKANKYGRIVSAASNVGLRGNFGQTNYAATKAGVIAMSKTWTVELGKYGITANAVAPGFTMTEMVKQIPQEHMARIRAGIPLGTVAEPMDIAYGYLYLASDEARFVSGICLTIDGGMSR